MRLLKYPIHLEWMIQVCEHVYNMKTCLFLYKTIGSEHVFISLHDITIFGRGSGEHVLTIANSRQDDS